ncbi:hypothetical protein P5673_033059, partial [Acropora cervicornis]
CIKYLLNFLCCQIMTAIRTMMIIERTPITIDKVVSLSGQLHLNSAKEYKRFGE